MFGSQALETAIGLVLMFFVLATAASAVVEIGSRFTRLRAKGLQRALARIVSGEQHPPRVGNAKADELIKLATGRTRSAYMSATSFADAVTELAARVNTVEGAFFKPMIEKLDALAREARGDLTKVKAGLETWFDQTMTATAETYKKFTAIILFCVGGVLAVSFNASTVHVTNDLWHDSVLRAAVVEAAGKTTTASTTGAAATCSDKNEITNAKCAIDKIDDFKLPLGYGDSSLKAELDLAHVAGWLLTALLVMLGAPFWFDLLTRLVALRGGHRPKPASEDGTSNSAMVANAAAPVPMPSAVSVPGDDATGTDWLATALNLGDDDAWRAAHQEAVVQRATATP
jgi:hypothetical protein